jgi:nanoRNase/pAp phosphatase (c-di-AMP/oligoRNAs hydrolase)
MVRQWSLRSTDKGIDVAELAKRHGGGGHKQAAGFEEDQSTADIDRRLP